MEIVNITATIEMETPFDLEYIINNIPFSEKSHMWVKVRIPPYKKYTAFYGSGKFLVTGVQNYDELAKVSNNVVDYLKKYGIKNEIKNININNHVALDNLNRDVDLNKLILQLNSYNVSYEPEQFPGLVFKDGYGITYLLFNSGKITITGIKSLENLEEKVHSFKQLIYEKSLED